jgi:hypothetical protein
VFLGACTPSTRGTEATVQLRDYRRVVLRFENTNIGFTITGAALGSQFGITASGSQLSNREAAQQAAYQFGFELELIGFVLAETLEEADAVVDFVIGPLKYDLIAGWTADAAHVRLTNARTGGLLASYRSEGAIGWTTTTSLVTSIAQRLQADF